MKTLLTYVAFIILYNFLFWHEELGVNLFLFGLAGIFYSYKTKTRKPISKAQGLVLFLTIASGISIVLFNSNFAKYMFFIGIIGSHLGFQTSGIAFVENLINGLISFFSFKGSLFPSLKTRPKGKRASLGVFLRIAIIPILIFAMYFLLFSNGNSLFQDLTYGYLVEIANFFEKFFSLYYIFFLAFGLFLLRWIFRKKWFAYFSIPLENKLLRKMVVTKAFRNLDLKYEYLTAIGVFGLLNLLFAFVNFIDIKNVWFQFDLAEIESLKSFVHEGVGWLIFSLLVSMGIILYFFRGNLNFYPNSKSLKNLAFAWIIQNLILAISVLFKTAYYVQYHGIATKRIGVFIFVLIVFFGLFSLYLKLKNQNNFAFILKWNSLMAFSIISIASVFPWDRITANFNLNHAVVHQIDVDNYLNLNPNTYPILYENLDKIESQILNHQNNNVRWIGYKSLLQFQKELDYRAINYLKQRRFVGLPSWTLADQKAEQILSEHFKDSED